MILKYILIIFSLCLSVMAKDFTLASYNVQNLFDLNYDKSEYKEYIPNTKSKWNKTNYQTKLNNISKVIKELNTDIIVLQEIESKKASQDLFKLLNTYKYSYFYKSDKQAIGLSIFSNYKILRNDIIDINYAKFNRAIVKSTLLIDNKKFIIYNNHFPSKRNSESLRVKYALTLYRDLNKMQEDIDYVIIGDLNSNYNENETFLHNKKLNDTSNLTAINDILYTRYDNSFINKNSILSYEKRVHYNPWVNILYKDRFSYIFKGKNSSPDNILLPASLFDNKNISYIDGSFKVFKPEYLVKKRKINRWKIKYKIHQNSGYSDHLPVLATFSTKSYKKDTTKINEIKDIYKNNNYTYPIHLKNVTVIYKSNQMAILKKQKDRAIMVYKNINHLRVGFSYDLEINKIDEYNGLKELSKVKILHKYKFHKNYKELYLDAQDIDILDVKYQNEVITNLQGVYKDKYFYFDDKKIRVYSKSNNLLPKNGQNINIINTPLSFYKDKMQIRIYKRSDIHVN